MKPGNVQPSANLRGTVEALLMNLFVASPTASFQSKRRNPSGQCSPFRINGAPCHDRPTRTGCGHDSSQRVTFARRQPDIEDKDPTGMKRVERYTHPASQSGRRGKVGHVFAYCHNDIPPVS
jgi:hypothetical protein